MHHRVDLVLAQYALEQRLIAHVSAHDDDLRSERPAQEKTLRHPVPHQAHNRCLALDKPACEPSAEKPGRTRDQGRPVPPEGCHEQAGLSLRVVFRMFLIEVAGRNGCESETRPTTYYSKEETVRKRRRRSRVELDARIVRPATPRASST